MNKNPQYSLKSSQKLKVLIFLIISLLFSQSIFSQFYWQRTYRSVIGGDEYAYDVCEADNNNFFIGGVAAPFFRNLFIIKIDQYGDTLWRKTYTEGEIFALEKTTDGGCIYVGARGSVAIAGRIESNGDTVWMRTFNAINIMDIKVTPDNNYILCGVEYSNDRYNGYICKMDLSGTIVWERTIPSNLSIDFLTVEVENNGNFVFGGVKRDISGGPRLAYICKTNDTGYIIWEKTYNVSDDNYCSSICRIDSGFIFTGRSQNNVFLQKINLNGDTIQKNILTNTSNISYSPVLLKHNSNRFYLIHVNGSNSRINCLDSNLSIKKQLTLSAGPPHALQIYSLIKVNNSILGDMILVGLTDFAEFANQDALAIRIDTALTPPPPLSVFNISQELPKSYFLSECYPNPFNPITKFKILIKKGGFIRICIYNNQGKYIKLYGNKYYNAGEYEYSFNAENLASGIYFYQLTVDEKFIASKKMCLIK